MVAAGSWVLLWVMRASGMLPCLLYLLGGRGYVGPVPRFVADEGRIAGDLFGELVLISLEGLMFLPCEGNRTNFFSLFLGGSGNCSIGWPGGGLVSLPFHGSELSAYCIGHSTYHTRHPGRPHTGRGRLWWDPWIY